MRRILALMATDHFSGPARQLLQMIEHVRRRGPYDYHMGFTWPANRPEPTIFNQFRRQGIALSVLDQKGRFDFSLVQQIKALIDKEKIDLIQTHGYKPSVLGFVLRMISGLPWIAFLHGSTAENFKVRCYFRLESLVVRKADTVITVSEAMRLKLLRQGFKTNKVFAVRNAIDPEKFQNSQLIMDNDSLNQVRTLREHGPIIGVIGRMSPEKGHAYFLQAFREILRKIPSARAVLIGTGSEETRLRKKCKDNGLDGHVLFVGFQQNTACWYPEIDLVVLPSLSEGLPNVAMEAMLFSRPVVATRVGGISEVVEDGVTGKLVPACDVHALAKNICAVINDPILRLKFGVNGRKKVIADFSPGFRAKRMIEVYNTIIGRQIRR